ncbi:MAG: hypothetical protein U0232_21430 [Thermomicrobiales bacterium]
MASWASPSQASAWEPMAFADQEAALAVGDEFEATKGCAFGFGACGVGYVDSGEDRVVALFACGVDGEADGGDGGGGVDGAGDGAVVGARARRAGWWRGSAW